MEPADRFAAVHNEWQSRFIHTQVKEDFCALHNKFT